MTLSLPTSPRFPKDSFEGRLTASLMGVSYSLRAWSVALAWEAASFTLRSHTIDEIWGDAEVTKSAGSLQVLVNNLAHDSANNAAVQGSQATS